MKILEIRNLNKAYKENKALIDINFSISKGEVVGIIGPNGAGKSTLFKIISGLVSSDKGKVRIDGTVSGIISKTPLYPYLTGKEHLKYISNINNNNVNMNEIEDFIGIGKYINKKVHTYSLGMKQRLSLGIVLLNNPDIIILDEPTNGLDYNGILELRELINELSQNKGKTIIIASHNLAEIDKICNRIIFINKGKITESIDIDNQYSSQFIIKFFTNELDNMYKGMLISKSDIDEKGYIVKSITEDEGKKILKYIIDEDIDYKELEIISKKSFDLEEKYNLFIKER